MQWFYISTIHVLKVYMLHRKREIHLTHVPFLRINEAIIVVLLNGPFIVNITKISYSSRRYEAERY